MGREPRSRLVVRCGAAAKAQGDAATPTRDNSKATHHPSPRRCRHKSKHEAVPCRSAARPGRASQGHCGSPGVKTKADCMGDSLPVAEAERHWLLHANATPAGAAAALTLLQAGPGLGSPCLFSMPQPELEWRAAQTADADVTRRRLSWTDSVLGPPGPTRIHGCCALMPVDVEPAGLTAETTVPQAEWRRGSESKPKLQCRFQLYSDFSKRMTPI